MDCQFSNPVNYLGEQPTTTTEIWNFKDFTCATETTELIINPNTQAEFYISKTLNYGDVILIWFLTFFVIYLIGKTIFNFFWGND